MIELSYLIMTHIIALISLYLIFIEKSSFQSWFFHKFCTLVHIDIRSIHLLSHWLRSLIHVCSFAHETRRSTLCCSFRWIWNWQLAQIIVVLFFEHLILWSKTVHLMWCAVIAHLKIKHFWLVGIPWLPWLDTVPIVSEHI